MKQRITVRINDALTDQLKDKMLQTSMIVDELLKICDIEQIALKIKEESMAQWKSKQHKKVVGYTISNESYQVAKKHNASGLINAMLYLFLNDLEFSELCNVEWMRK